MRKRVILVLIMIALALTLTACYSSKYKDNNLQRRRYLNNGSVIASAWERGDDA